MQCLVLTSQSLISPSLDDDAISDVCVIVPVVDADSDVDRRKKLDQEIVKDGQLRRKEDDLGDIWGESALFQPVAHFLGLLQLPEVHFGRITQIKFCTTPHSKQIIQSQSSSTSISDEPEREQRTLLGITGKTNKLVLFGVRSIKDAFHHIRRREKRQKQKIDGWNEDEEEDQNNDNDNEQKKGKSKQKEKEQLNQSTSLNITSQKTGSGLNQIQNISDLTPSDIFLVHSVITATARIDSFSFSQLQMQKSINQKKQQLDLKSLKKQRIAEQIQDSLFSADLILGLSANSMELYRVPSIISSQQQEQTNNELKGQTNDSNQTLLSPTLMQRLGITSHPSPIRFISLSEDAALLATASLGCVIVWNTATHQPIRRLITPAPTSLLFAPGSKYIIVGSSDGRLEIFDISTARLMKSLRDRGNVGQIVGQTIDPHTNSSSKVASQSSNGAIWSIVLNPDKSGVATGGAGGEINFWNFDLEFEQEEDEDDDEEDEKDDEEEEDDELERNSKIKKGKDKKKDNKKNNKGEKKKKTKKDTKMQKDQQKKPQSMSQAYLTLQYTRTLKLNDEVLCISFSPDAKIIAAGLLDNTIQLFYADTLKYALTCYGHSLPVTTIAFSDDGALLVSGGADKDVRIWSATRGDMRGKMHGHDAAVTVIIPLRGTHYFISAGRDGDIRQWDADTFECAQSLKTNKSNGTTILGLAASPDGGSVFGAGSDRCIRQWEISNEQIFRGEDQEEREEDQLEEETIRMVDEQRQGGNNQDGTIERGTAESLKGTEALIQAIEDEEKYRKAKFIDLGGEKLMQKDAVDQLEGNVGIQISDISQSSSSSSSIVSQIAPIPTVPSLLAKLQTIPTPSISAALSALPLPHARRLLQLLPKVIDDNPDTVELIHRVTHTLLTQHFTETIFGMNSQNESQIVGELGEKITEQLSKRKDIVSFNLAALGLLQRSLEEDVNKFFGAEERLREAEAAKKQRKRRSGAKR
ncbi:MAG: putative U3 small nucleolar RNA-associated protein 12 [Streblomastix strix]|uniref:Putative U3 small nucleolar RNA-associated protein 12 n=1 Tax=Streblomastix strix TaxID=222440 RepID=A0A5J4WYZ2_9EUKA|nr:MAG: putative U3 small nucleolar RNA-associated protein 12 [Streblomastix strix]